MDNNTDDNFLGDKTRKNVDIEIRRKIIRYYDVLKNLVEDDYVIPDDILRDLELLVKN